MTDVTVVIGAGGIGQAIARRISNGRHILVANHTQESADAAARVLEGAGFETTAMQADVSDRTLVQAVIAKAQELGPIKALVQAAGVSPSQAPIEAILKDTLHAYQMSKRCNSLRVRGEAINWAKRGARINSISSRPAATSIATVGSGASTGPGRPVPRSNSSRSFRRAEPPAPGPGGCGAAGSTA